MAKSDSGGSGTVVVPASEVQAMLRTATALPSTFFLVMEKAKVLADGSLEAKYTYSNTTNPPPPQAAEKEE